MRTRFSTFDILCTVQELQKYVGMRVNNIYDIDSRTYLFRLQRSEEKCVLLLESGMRIHITNFEWPKNTAPSGFSMKLRKHLNNKRLEYLRQLGRDRIVDMQFGTGDAAYHVILELYDRGNIILTDHEMLILNVLRPHSEGDRFKFVVREKYPEDRARKGGAVERETLQLVLQKAKSGDQIRKLLIPHLDYGPDLIEHVLLGQDIGNNAKINKTFFWANEEQFEGLYAALEEAESIMHDRIAHSKNGYIIQKREERAQNKDDVLLVNKECHPMLFRQHENSPNKQCDSFNAALDEFFSTMESQKIELKVVQQERVAFKKLENVRKDHTQRLQALALNQIEDQQKAELIMRNELIVEKAIVTISALVKRQMPWPEIETWVKDSASDGDEIAKRIVALKLDKGQISIQLEDPYIELYYGGNAEDEQAIASMVVDVKLDLSVHANARQYFTLKRHAATKENKTIEAQDKALKSAERKTQQQLKEVRTISNIQKMRKVYWFEKFFWFISSENYLVIGGRDQIQNELIVKRYLHPKDVYVHADVHGASSIVIKNPTALPVPPKTLNEAGIMAICYSIAWEAKVITNAYWVWGDQVGKSAPSGEYLTTGSFMIRGKKQFLPTAVLTLGLGFVFKLEDASIERHRGERKVQTDESLDADFESEAVDIAIPEGSSDDDSEEDNAENKFPDTQIKIEHTSDRRINIITENKAPLPPIAEEISYVNGCIVQKQTTRSFKTEPEQQECLNDKTLEDELAKENNQQMKRGQRSKLKKIKEKYKDQDEEERKLRMEILQSAGTPKESKRKAKRNKVANMMGVPKAKVPSARKQGGPPKNAAIDDPGDVQPINAEVDIIDSLTGIPHPDDELLFAIPVIAPYNTLTNYKFKVKLTPGNGRRGKAASTAIEMFLKDRNISIRERDLLKAVKGEQVARNIPGKVKLSAPKMQQLRK